MKLLVDAHCHTVASGHAFSTVDECAREASKKGLEMFAVTDHGMKMPGGPHVYHFWNLHIIPDYIYGVRVLKGVEANILDMQGNIDVSEAVLERLDIVLASMHDPCIQSLSASENTQGYINAMKNPYIDIIAHSGNPAFPIDVESFVDAAKYYNKVIEINNCSLKGGVREGSKANCSRIIDECVKKGVYICTSTDAHIAYDVGNFDKIIPFLEDNKVDEDLIISTSKAKFIKVLRSHGKEVE